jgi:hypothetical protein
VLRNFQTVSEGEFSEVQRSKLGRVGEDLGTWTAVERGFDTHGRRAGLIRSEDSLQAVATCYASDFRE